MATKDRQINKRQNTAKAANAVRRRKRRNGRRAVHNLFVIVFLLAAGLALCLTVFFKIEAVNVIGVDKYDPVEIAGASGVSIGDNLFRVSAKKVSQSLLENFPYIETVEVSRSLPPSVEILITQSVPVGAIVQSGEYVLITREGKVLERGMPFLPEDIMLIKGVDTHGKQPGEYMGRWEPEAKPAGIEAAEARAERQKRNVELEAMADEENECLKMLSYLIDAMKETGFEDITNVDLTDRLNMQVMYENRLLLKLGSEADLPYKLEFVRTTVEFLHKDARGTINAANANSKRVLYKPEAGYRIDGSPITEPDANANGDGTGTSTVQQDTSANGVKNAAP